MMELEKIPEQLKSSHNWEKRQDGWWIYISDMDIEEMARLMVASKCRLATVSVYPDYDGNEYRIAYIWDYEGQLMIITTVSRGNCIQSIAAICPAADWIERETRDYFGIGFTNREDLSPIVLRPGDPVGIFNWNGSKGGKE